MNLKKPALALAVLALALAAARGAAPALSLGWYAAGCDDALAQNPGDPAGCRYEARERDCGNGVDDDSDERTDAADPDCGGYCGDGACAGGESPASCDSDCGCPPWSLFDPSTWSCGGRCAPSELDLDGDCAADFRPWGHACADGEDGDGDGAVDCADPDCERAFPACLGGYCGDGVCGAGESWCAQDCGGCLASESAGACANGADDDCDGRVDCADADCAGWCTGAGRPATGATSYSYAGGAVSGAGAELGLRVGLGAGVEVPPGALNPADVGGSLPTAGPAAGVLPPVSCPVSYMEYGPLSSCHDTANLFCDLSKGIGWDTRVLQCGGVDTSIEPAGHTVNLYLKSQASSEWCVQDPQGGGDCCFVDYACSADDISLAPGTPGGACAKDVCGDRYRYGNENQCRVLPAGSGAFTELDRVLSCPELTDDNSSCLECCGEVNRSLNRRWLDAWLHDCDDFESYDSQARALSDVCVAACEEDPARMESLLDSFPPDFASVIRGAL